jgi:hypothetical protein
VAARRLQQVPQMCLPEVDMTHDTLVSLFETYNEENEKFEKGNKAAGTRARKALSEIAKLCKDRRSEIQNQKNNG